MSKHGYKKPQDAKIYEAKCNMTEAGTMCEVHGDKACSSDKVPEAGVGKRGMIADKKKLQEVLTKKTPASEVISDFVHSKNKTFSGDSKKQRINRALGAYYGMQKEETALKGYGPADRGTVDGYYGRKPDPHKFIAGQDGGRQRVKLTDPDEIKQYMSAHKDDSVGSKVYEEEQIVEISDALALSTARGALKSMNDADVNTDKGLATFQKRTKTQAMALDKMNPDYKRLKAKVGTSDANAKDAAYRDAVKEENINEITKKKKTQKESAPGDTPIRMPSGNVGDSDTGRI